MSGFWLWFWRPIAEFLGTVAFIAAAILLVLVCVILYACYRAIREKYCAHDWFNINGQWMPAKYRCRKCGLESASLISPNEER